ncbi:E3 ubiquitin-protein ligase TRIM39-like [Gouania willdenowi]|uniref:E3 ubiquitin-protein ligase TRIM39-like n=1 Tax=Gouania willdenowi TaxID=441366 RepID=UPI0010555C5E|nr:E3 ubiquitin-protein ligase TRIM39-like [Gouania willdenowi]
MSAACSGTSEHHFLCSICLEVFTDPVTTPCGHNFCESCISTHWDTNVGHTCPMCNQRFSIKPQLKVNTLMRDVVSQFRREAAAPGEVPCDVCTGTKVKALKSCLDCVLSYCETHLDLHLTASGLRRHQLVEPVENLETRMCPKHSKPLEMFCKCDQTCVCLICSVMEHKSHQLVPLREECEEKKVELEKIEADLQQMIQKRREKLEKIRESARIRKIVADREKAEGVEVLTVLKKMMETMEEQQEAEEREAEDLIKELEKEISELMKRSSEVEQLSCSEDHLHLLQHFCSLKAPPATKDWTKVIVHPSSYEGTVLRALGQLEYTLNQKMMKIKMMDMKKKKKKKKKKMKLEMMKQFAVDVTLDPLTAHPDLAVSDDGKQVYDASVLKNLPDNPERFSVYMFVLAKQSFSSGRFYFEVQVKGKTDWDFGVASETIDRKGPTVLSPQNGYWSLFLTNGNVYGTSNSHEQLDLKSVPEKVGVFVDYEEGVVSFYDVDAAALIYSFTNCCFTNELFPFFCPCFYGGGKNAPPLIICQSK